MGAPENLTMRDKGQLAHNAVKALMAAVDNAGKPGGGTKTDWGAAIASAQAAADAAVDAFETAIAAT